MSDVVLKESALVLFKGKPARVVSVADKVSIELPGGAVKKVRPKDFTILHSGPLSSVGSLVEPEGNVDEAWEMLSGETVGLADLAEFVYGEFTPASAWSSWQLVEQGIYFKGDVDSIEACSEEDVSSALNRIKEKAEAKSRWEESIGRIKNGCVTEEDDSNLNEVEKLAYGKTKASKVMRDLKMEQAPEKAHKLLMRLGRWNEFVNPYPSRLGCALENPEHVELELPEENRVDLTHLEAYAIDDEGNKDPDDAISVDGDTLWIHVADVASVITPGSDLDKIAQSRGANLYVPEGCVHMLPQSVTDMFGLGLSEISPALSIGVKLDDDANISDVKIVKSFVKVTRVSYEEVNSILDQEPYSSIYKFTKAYESRRMRNGAASVDMPEVKIKVDDGVVSIRPLPRYESREMVTNAMLTAGEAVALFCEKNEIAVPHVTQAPPEEFDEGDDLATHFSNIKKFNKSELKMSQGYHAGLGMDAYVRSTSPLRRYTDLLAHQQLRAFLGGETTLSEEEVLEKVSETELASFNIRRAERESNKHWTLVYLMQNEAWQGEATLIDIRNNRGLWMISELNLQTRLSLKPDAQLNDQVELAVNSVELSELVSRFRIV